MKKAKRAALQDQIDMLAWLHAERDHHLLHAFQDLVNVINNLAWLHAERGHFLQQFIESEQRLITRARAVKAAKTQAEQASMGVPA